MFKITPATHKAASRVVPTRLQLSRRWEYLGWPRAGTSVAPGVKKKNSAFARAETPKDKRDGCCPIPLSALNCE